MYKSIALFCLFALICACGPLPDRNQSGLFGRYPENYDNGKGFTLWMPKHMHARQGMYAFVVQKYMNYCENGDYNGGEFKSDEYIMNFLTVAAYMPTITTTMKTEMLA